MHLTDYITEYVVSRGNRKKTVDYTAINKKTRFNEFVKILDDLGYERIGLQTYDELYPVQKMIYDILDADGEKKYAVQESKTLGGYWRVVFSNHETPTSSIMFCVDFLKGKGIDDMVLYCVSKYHIEGYSDANIKELVKYIQSAEK